MTDDYSSMSPSLTSPAVNAEAVVPSNTVALSNVSRAIYVGGGGDIAIEMLSGTTVTLRAAAAGTFLPLRAKKILSSGTTASGLVNFW